MLRSNLSNYSDVYIVIKRIITAESNNANNRTDKMLIFKNNNSFRSFISKVNNTFINNRDLDIVRSMSNLLEYSDNYSMTWTSLCNYYEINDDTNRKNADTLNL